MTLAMRKLPPSERPRERLMIEGEEVLSVTELLAIVLGSGTVGKSVLSLSQELLSRFGSLHQLIDASIEELKEVKGIGTAKAIQLRAVFALARRSNREISSLKVRIDRSAIAFDIAAQEIGHYKQEVLLVLLRDSQGRLICKERVSMGTVSELLVHPREVFYPAIRHKATSMILAHNHPSGDVSPSSEDLAATRALVLSGRTMGIEFVDHIILSDIRYLSLREAGYLGDSLEYP